jgi:hypothetical protein
MTWPLFILYLYQMHYLMTDVLVPQNPFIFLFPFIIPLVFHEEAQQCRTEEHRVCRNYSLQGCTALLEAFVSNRKLVSLTLRLGT